MVRAAVRLIAAAAVLALPGCGASEEQSAAPGKATQTASPTPTESSNGSYGY